MFNLNEFNNNFSPELLGYIPLILVILALWSLIWKGIALWRSARSGHQGWFVAFLLIQTLGILEIIYIVFVNKKDSDSQL